MNQKNQTTNNKSRKILAISLCLSFVLSLSFAFIYEKYVHQTYNQRYGNFDDLINSEFDNTKNTNKNERNIATPKKQEISNHSKNKPLSVPYSNEFIEMALLSTSFCVSSFCMIFAIYYFITKIKKLNWWKTLLISSLFSTGIWFLSTSAYGYICYYTSLYNFYKSADISRDYIWDFIIPQSSAICFLVSIFVFIIVFFILSLISFIVNFKNKKTIKSH